MGAKILSRPALLLFLFFAAVPVFEAQAMDCGNCYRIDTGTLVGVVTGDVVLTIIIIIVVYFCARQKNELRSGAEDNKVYMNMPNR
ncbi:hematopoietic cell signal transducer isoform X2 [Ambystoma mexicanum]|uniref:hematopoietic cell signal transducer isoform X2 n=1 Tax=Ambystoma mexicanum TaxID=8296 RepID=UPI0037E7B824